MYIKLIQHSELFETPSRHLDLEAITDIDGDLPAPSVPSLVKTINGLFKAVGLDLWSKSSH
jgi:hypothetical protein